MRTSADFMRGDDRRRLARRKQGTLAIMVTLLVGRSPLYTAPAQGEAPASRATIADHVRFLAGDKIRDRIVGRPGIELAARYVADAFKADGLQPGGDDGSYVQVLNATVPPRKTAVPTKNVIGIVPGAGSLAGECIVIGAHYDSAIPEDVGQGVSGRQTGIQGGG